MSMRWVRWLHGERLPRWMAGGLLLLAAWQAGRWAAAWLEPWQPPPLPELSFSSAEETAYQALPPSLFGFSTASSPPVEAQRKVSAAQLGIQLLGVISLSDGKGVAIVRLKNGQRRAVRTGETIRPGLVLMQVAPDRVVLSVNGEAVWVPLNPPRASDALLSTQATSPPLETLARQLRRQPFKLFEYVSVQPVSQGVRIQARPGQSGLLTQLGLQDGDVIVAVEGQPIKALMNQPNQWQQLIDRDQWRLRVLREGRYEEIEVRL